MADYFTILSRALERGDSGNAAWRHKIYDRTRQLLLTQLRARKPQLSDANIKKEMAELDAAIASIEDQFAQSEQGSGLRADSFGLESEDETSDQSDELVARSVWAGSSKTPIVLAIVFAAIAAGAYAIWATRSQHRAPTESKNETTMASAARAHNRPRTTTLTDGDLAPGIDGGSSEADVGYVLRRQPVFYRTTLPVGAIIIDQTQHFLYLTQPNSVALRYGIGIGKQCANLSGLRKISAKAKWPQWQPDPDMIKRKLARPGMLAGGPGNPLGARELALDDGSSKIHGTNAPKTIGTSSLQFGCIRLVNDDISDLYDRVEIGTRVVFGK